MELITLVLADISVFVAVISFPVHDIAAVMSTRPVWEPCVVGGARQSGLVWWARQGAAQAPADHSVQPEPFDMISQFSWLRCLSLCMISQLRCPHGLYDIMQSAISC